MQTEDIKISKYKDLVNIKTIDNGEQMVNLSELYKDLVCKYEQQDMIHYVGEDIWVRQTVANKLQKISDSLKKIKPEYKLKIVYGFRHPEIQKLYFEKRKEGLRIKNLNIDEDDLNEMANSMTAFPETAGHPTGGAVDITITTNLGDLDMGTTISDFSDIEKIKTYSKNINLEQKSNRKILHDLMIAENFAPFYGEWWHFSYGDKEWAWFYGKNNACYNQINFQTKNSG
ncbi:D-alanyl-D-alanine carboxypeptidase family protein [Candidatus Nomurabacteria bacterium]|nr:D-alanyl-D-alanine carboxypeptidase family protein [Candidatus Nomurabacteria bacterium]